MKLAIIGYGYWGPNLLRNFRNTEGCQVVGVADPRNERLALAQKHAPDLRLSTDPSTFLFDPQVEAVVVATPVDTHYPLGKQALEQGKHLLLEKPMTSSRAHAEELAALAQKHNRVLMVDHTFLYNSAVRKLKELVTGGALGQLNYLDSTRINLGLFQHDVNVIWDLAPHDISIMNYLMDEKPESVQAIGAAHTPSGLENIAYLVVHFASGAIAHFNCSWISPVKIRQMLVGGDQKMVLWNDMEPTEKIKIFDKGIKVSTDEQRNRVLVDYRTGDIHVPKLPMVEPLSLMARDFVDAVGQGAEPVSNWLSGLTVVKVLEASQQSISQEGKRIFLD